MTHEQKLKFIRHKCIEANPSRHEPWEYDTGEPVGSGYIKTNPCRLADVLLACPKGPEFFDKYVIPIVDLWNLRETLNNQPERTVDFLYQLFN